MNVRLSLVTSGLLISLLGLVTPSAVMLYCAVELRLQPPVAKLVQLLLLLTGWLAWGQGDLLT